jgi:hypothetical protein
MRKTLINKAERIQLRQFLNLVSKLERKLGQTSNSKMSTLYTENETCQVLKTDKKTLNRWVSRGVITPANRFNQFKKQEVENLKKRVTK